MMILFTGEEWIDLEIHLLEKYELSEVGPLSATLGTIDMAMQMWLSIPDDIRRDEKKCMRVTLERALKLVNEFESGEDVTYEHAYGLEEIDFKGGGQCASEQERQPKRRKRRWELK